MTNPYYTATGAPTAASRGLSAAVRDEFQLIQDACDLIASAVNPALVTGTSATSMTIGTGPKSFTMTTDLGFGAGQDVVIASTASPSNRMIAVLQSYDRTTGATEVTVNSTGGTGTFAAWTISLTVPSTADVVTYSAKTTAFTISDGDHDAWFDCTSGTFAITFNTVAMRVGFKCRIRNSGTGDITIPSSDGVTNWLMYAGEERDFVWDGSVWRTTVLNAFIKQFTGSGSFIVPPGYDGTFDVVGVGGGGGGGSGARRAAATATGGGGGGGGGVRVERRLYGLAAGSTVAVTIGAGGSGGAAISADSTAGNNGTAGGNTTFDAYLTAYGGGRGGGGPTTANAGAGGGGAGFASVGGDAATSTAGSAGNPASSATSYGGAAGSVTNTDGTPALKGGGGGGGGGLGGTAGAGGNSLFSAGAGGGGGGIDAGDVVRSPAAGGATNNYAPAAGSGGAAGASNATAPTAGTAGATGNAYSPGAGGGGGGSATGAAAAAGGAGGAPGGGGGGGGASRNGFNSGAGGAGARGELIIAGVLA